MKYKSGANLLPVCLATNDTSQAPASGWVYFIKYLIEAERGNGLYELDLRLL